MGGVWRQAWGKHGRGQLWSPALQASGSAQPGGGAPSRGPGRGVVSRSPPSVSQL